MEKLEIVQYQTALSVTGAWYGSNCSKHNEELGRETLSDRRMCRRILQIHKIMNNKTPSYLKDKLPPKHRPFLFNVVRKIKCKTNRYMNSFFPRAISSWNLVISHFEVFPSSDSLKIKYFWCTRSCRSSISVSIKSETKSFEKPQKAIITSLIPLLTSVNAWTTYTTWTWHSVILQI